jgi:hypothetical protein
MSSPPKLKNMFYESSAIVKTIVWPWEDILNLYMSTDEKIHFKLPTSISIFHFK